MAEPGEPAFLLRLDGFEGPMDLLLELARGQKVDLARISILSLVEQYLAIVEGAARVRLELAADWLVMAAWLTWLKSRLLLPPGDEAAEEGGEAAEVLASRLEALAHVQRGARWLAGRAQLGIEVFGRGAAERLVVVDRSALAADLVGLMRGYMAAVRRGGRSSVISRGGRRCGVWRMRWRGWSGCSGGCRVGWRWSRSCRMWRGMRCSGGRRWRARCWRD